MNRKIVALIPARGRSKGVHRKNLHLVYGIPLIDYTINAALSVKEIEEVYVSSDDVEIIEHSQTKGVKIINRPAHYATDQSSAVSVVNHFLETLPNNVQKQNLVIIYLQPTSPLRNKEHISKAIKLINGNGNGDSGLVSVVEMDKSPYKSFKIDKNGTLKSLFDEHLSNARRQDLPTTYIPNGAIYIFSAEKFIKHEGFPSNNSIPYVMSKVDSIDVDTMNDIKTVEQILINYYE